jgi:hypothetical protein
MRPGLEMSHTRLEVPLSWCLRVVHWVNPQTSCTRRQWSSRGGSPDPVHALHVARYGGGASLRRRLAHDVGYGERARKVRRLKPHV